MTSTPIMMPKLAQACTASCTELTGLETAGVFAAYILFGAIVYYWMEYYD